MLKYLNTGGGPGVVIHNDDHSLSSLVPPGNGGKPHRVLHGAGDNGTFGSHIRRLRMLALGKDHIPT